MSRGEETDGATIALKMHTEPRRFRALQASRDEAKSEDDLLNDARHYLILGDPGAGKTTTIKRLVRRLFLEDAAGLSDVYQYPIVIRIRELRQPNVSVAIADALGIGYTTRIRRDDDVSSETETITSREATVKLTGETLRRTDPYDYFVGDVRLETVVADALNSTRAVVLLDGLDEARTPLRFRIQDEISALASRLTASKVVVSCRAGDYTRLLEGFDLMELCPLTSEQIADIASFWLPDATSFIACLNALPYRDVVDRPLLLVQLLFIYKRYGYLPTQPALVYRKLVSTLLHEWDAERGIIRASAYADFNAERKAEFLAALSYELTYRLRAKAFSEADLIQSYEEICERFSLPRSEAIRVVRELESHTGLLTAGYAYTFEFCHLSLQEYLCADYLVRQPVNIRTWKYLSEYPAPLAVATALSSDPSVWFATLVLTADATALSEAAQGLAARTVIERPGFTKSDELGVSILRLLDVAPIRAQSAVLGLLNLPNVPASVAAALKYFRYDGRISKFGDRTIWLTAVSKTVGEYELPVPLQGAIPVSAVANLAEERHDDALLLWRQVQPRPRPK